MRACASPPPTPLRRRVHLLGVGAVPEDGVAVGHHFGTGLLAEYAHQEQHADEKDHFHLQHHYGANFGHVNSSSGGSASAESSFSLWLQPGQVTSLIHARVSAGAARGRPRVGNAHGIRGGDGCDGGDVDIRG